VLLVKHTKLQPETIAGFATEPFGVGVSIGIGIEPLGPILQITPRGSSPNSIFNKNTLFVWLGAFLVAGNAHLTAGGQSDIEDGVCSRQTRQARRARKDEGYLIILEIGRYMFSVGCLRWRKKTAPSPEWAKGPRYV
jgi:hypothetical protein